MSGHERLVAERKRRLFAPLHGRVLEIGAGAGANMPYLPADIKLLALEPNGYFHEALRSTAQRHSIQLQLIDGSAEHIPIADESLDAVISTLVLCSVQHQEAVLREIHRVLKFGGRFCFLEHVAAPRGRVLRTVQDWWNPAHGWLCDGCHLNRDTESAICEVGFSQVEAEQFETGLPLVSPHLSGFAIK